MRPIPVSVLLCLAALIGCNRESAPESTPVIAEAVPPPAAGARFASFNTSLFSDEDGGTIRRLEAGDAKAKQIAAVIQQVRPDVILLNEFDYDEGERAAELFQQRFLEVAQFGGKPIRYEHRFLAPVNTGVPSGLDLDNDGRTDTGNDAWGYGQHPGQYGMLVLSRFPIDIAQARTFQHLLWKDLPRARRPMNPDGSAFNPDEVWNQLRLSSKSHWDVPIETPLGRIHFLVSHPTPPVFDGAENRNGLRNHDEIRLWAEYITPGDKPWLCDDAGRCGGLPGDASFVIAGDQNADPVDGAGEPGAISQLLDHPRVNATFVPQSEGGARLAAEYGHARLGDPRSHTGDFGPRVGTLRLDYVLPSRDLQVRDGGIFWPISPPEHVEWSRASDHHLVWLDLEPATGGTSP
jgi:endonuclease/exonuclease/phosphatase family metal-dependent hydrolase